MVPTEAFIQRTRERVVNNEFENYENIQKRSSVLDELVIHVETVNLQDSLQRLARMPEEERLAIINKIIEQVKKEEEEAQYDDFDDEVFDIDF